MKEKIIVKNKNIEEELISELVKEHIAKQELDFKQNELRIQAQKIDEGLRSIAQKLPEQKEKIFSHLNQLVKLRKR